MLITQESYLIYFKFIKCNNSYKLKIFDYTLCIISDTLGEPVCNDFVLNRRSI
jgi:hypothetical protein